VKIRDKKHMKMKQREKWEEIDERARELLK
jgi:hypothetical protein